ASRAAQLAIATLGDDQEQLKQWLNDPQKLLEMIAAAQGSQGAGGLSGRGTSPGPGAGEGTSAGGTGAGGGFREGDGRPGGEGVIFYSGSTLSELVGSGTHIEMRPVSSTQGSIGANAAGSGPSEGRVGGGRPTSGEPSEEEIYGILSALTSLGQLGAGGSSGVAAEGVFQEHMSQLPGRAQDLLKAALAELAARAPDAKPDQSTLVRLAEHLAIRFALERYEKGEVKVN